MGVNGKLRSLLNENGFNALLDEVLVNLKNLGING